jgi:hypothetical protein
MNGKKAKAMRRLAESITARKGLPARHAHSIDLGLGNVRIVNAADTTRGQYRALKAVVKAAYGRAAA